MFPSAQTTAILSRFVHLAIAEKREKREVSDLVEQNRELVKDNIEFMLQVQKSTKALHGSLEKGKSDGLLVNGS